MILKKYSFLLFASALVIGLTSCSKKSRCADCPKFSKVEKNNSSPKEKGADIQFYCLR